MAIVTYVSVNKSYRPGMSTDELVRAAHGNWPISLSKASASDTVVALAGNTPLMAWPVHAAFATDETYETTGGPRSRVAFALGSPIPIDPSWHELPAMRRGVAVAER